MACNLIIAIEFLLIQAFSVRMVNNSIKIITQSAFRTNLPVWNPLMLFKLENIKGMSTYFVSYALFLFNSFTIMESSGGCQLNESITFVLERFLNWAKWMMFFFTDYCDSTLNSIVIPDSIYFNSINMPIWNVTKPYPVVQKYFSLNEES